MNSGEMEGTAGAGGELYDAMAEPQPDLFGRRDVVDAAVEFQKGALQARFLVPPFSILDARQGYWSKRKAQWIALGLRGEEGRGHVIEGSDGAVSGKVYNINDWAGKKKDFSSYANRPGTSVFDPVLCEVVFRWFAPPHAAILDPFAGEATKGIVAAVMGHRYTGIEVREEQVRANYVQAERIGVCPQWTTGDSVNLSAAVPPDARFDLVFTSPPYFDLEVYSAQDEDGSTIGDYPLFMAWYGYIFAQCVARLRDNRFLVVKVGDVRDDETGAYRDFVGDNVRFFRNLGLHLYNDIVLVTQVGTLPLRVGRAFQRTRKVGKTHQNILVFYKGNPRQVSDHFPELGADDAATTTVAVSQ